jgi:hypothetical protein
MYSEFQDLFPITLLLESFVPFNLGSYLRKIDGHWTGDLYSVTKTCKLTMDKVLLMIFNGFRYIFF